MGDEENLLVKKQIADKKNLSDFKPGVIIDSRTKTIKENKFVFKIGSSSLPVPGLIQFDPKEEQELQFSGCISTRQTENGETIGNYALFSSNLVVDGIDGRDSNLEIDINNLFDVETDNLGQLFNSSNVSVNTKSENLNNIILNNNSFINYPYQKFDSNHIHDISFKKIYFIPHNDSTYEIKVRNKIQSLHGEDNYFYNKFIGENNNSNNIENNELPFIAQTEENGYGINNSFKFYNNVLEHNENSDSSGFIQVNNNGSIIFNAREQEVTNSLFNHSSLKKISFFFTNLQIDNNTKSEYFINDNCLIINYQNFKKTINSIDYYFNAQVKLVLDTNTIPNQFTDNDFDLKPGSIVISYGKVVPQLSDFLIGLSNNVGTDEVKFNKYIDTNFKDENGFGVPKLNASIGIYYEDSNYTQQNIIDNFTGKITHITKGRDLGDYNLSGYSAEKTFRLKVKDSDWSGYYSDSKLGTDYYIKILDLGEYLPSKIFVAIQSIFDFPKYVDLKGKKGEFYSSISGTDSIFNGEFNFDDAFDSTGNVIPWESYIFNFRTNLVIPSNLNNNNKWEELELTVGSGAILKIKPDAGGNISKTTGTIIVTSQGSGYRVGDILIVEAGKISSNSTRLEITLDDSVLNNGILKIDENNLRPLITLAASNAGNSEVSNIPTLTDSSGFQDGIFNSKLHKIFVKKCTLGSFDSNGLYSDVTTTTKYLLKIIYTLKSDTPVPPTNKLNTTTTNIGHGPFHFNPLYRKTLNYKNITSYIEGNIYNLELESNTTYTLSIVDYKDNPNRKLYGFNLNLYQDNNFIEITELNNVVFPTIEFTTETNIDNYQLLVRNDRKVPFYGIKIEKKEVDRIKLLTIEKPNKKFDITNIFENTPKLLLSYDEKTESDQYGEYLKNEVIYRIILEEENTSTLGSYGYYFQLNHNLFNTCFLGLNTTTKDFLDILTIQARYYNLDYSYKEDKNYNYKNLNKFSMDFDQTTLILTENNLKNSISNTLTNAIAGTYTNISTSSDVGVGAKLSITIDNFGDVDKVTVTNKGSGYSVGDKLIVEKGQLGTDLQSGNESSILEFILTENNFDVHNFFTNEVFLVEKIINQVQTISNLTTGNTNPTTSGRNIGCHGGSGIGCTVDYTISGGVINNVTINQRGRGYTVNNTLTIKGTDTTFDVATLSTTTNHMDLTHIDETKANFIFNEDTPELSDTNIERINVSTVGGSGTGCTVDFDIDINDKITNLRINQGGTGYNKYEKLFVSGTETSFFIDCQGDKLPLPYEIYKNNFNEIKTNEYEEESVRNINNKELTLDNSDPNNIFYKTTNSFTIFESRYFIDFPINDNEREFPILNNVSDLFDCIVVGFNIDIMSGVFNINKIKIEVSESDLTFYTKIVGSTTTDDSANNYLEKDSDNNLIYGLSNNSIFEIDNLTVDSEQTQSKYLGRIYIGFDDKTKLKTKEEDNLLNTEFPKTRAKIDFDLDINIHIDDSNNNQIFLNTKILYP